MSTPMICCVCLTADRQRLTDRAVRCFLSQSYESKWMLIFDTGKEPYHTPEDIEKGAPIAICRDNPNPQRTIPALRNEANGLAGRADVIAHWDSDDWSSPSRLFLQVEELTVHQATGFSNMLFFDSRENKGHAWEYAYQDHRLVLGTSLLYWRSAWLAHPFNESKIEGEEKWWPNPATGARGTNGFFTDYPLMIADYHGGNTGQYGKSDSSPCIFDQTPAQRAHNPQFRRAPEWDSHCREVMI
jgi:hypothetical protein